ncbi:MAG TPA: FAD-dependent oxidoreductase [Pseudonocardiaceae bacterium]|nr:FAD-dependent oxidoreductase [Pseudonocardiaceae bacterium]
MLACADLIVLGAGPAGLAAAWRAGRAGLSTIVLERAGAVGGMAASFEVAGVRVDHGSHRLHPATPPAVLADLRGLLGDDLQCRPRHGRLRVAGQWVGFPLRPGELLRALPPGMLGRITADALTEPLRRCYPLGRRPAPASYAEALRTSLGATLYDALYAPYAVKLWGLPGEQIDPEQARRRVSADTPWKIAHRMLRQRQRDSAPGRIFYYPRRGFGQIVDALATAAVGAGAQLRLGTEVDRVCPGQDGVLVHTHCGQTLAARHLFTTIPLPLLARIASPAPPRPATDAAAALRFRSMVLVYLVHEGRPWTSFDAHYLPGPDTPVSRISEPANYRESASDPDDRTVLCCEIPCQLGDRWWSAEDAALAAMVSRTLHRTGLPPVRITEVVTRRLRTVYPVYQTGYAEHLTGLDAWASALPHVTTFGRLGLFVHDNTHHAIAMAYDAVHALQGGHWDATAWSAARHRFTTHVVED